MQKSIRCRVKPVNGKREKNAQQEKWLYCWWRRDFQFKCISGPLLRPFSLFGALKSIWKNRSAWNPRKWIYSTTTTATTNNEWKWNNMHKVGKNHPLPIYMYNIIRLHSHTIYPIRVYYIEAIGFAAFFYTLVRCNTCIRAHTCIVIYFETK